MKERYDYIDVIDLEVDSEAESVSSSCSSIRITGMTHSPVKIEGTLTFYQDSKKLENSDMSGTGSSGKYIHAPIKDEVKNEPGESSLALPPRNAIQTATPVDLPQRSHKRNQDHVDMMIDQEEVNTHFVERSTASAPPRKPMPPIVDTQLNASSGNKDTPIANSAVDSQNSASSTNDPGLPVVCDAWHF